MVGAKAMCYSSLLTYTLRTRGTIQHLRGWPEQRHTRMRREKKLKKKEEEEEEAEEKEEHPKFQGRDLKVKIKL